MDNINCISDNNENTNTNTNITLLLDDIKNIWKKDFTEIKNSKDKLIGKLFNFNIYEFKKMFLIGFSNSVSRSWYKLYSINDLHIFIDYFQNINREKEEMKTDRQENKTEKQIKLYLTSRLNFRQLIRYFYFHEFIDKSIYSENDKIDVKKITYYDEILLFDKFIESITVESHVTFITKYSQSKLIISCNNDGYYVKILYKPLKLLNRFKILPKDVPTDVDLILLNLNVIQTKNIMEDMDKITENEIDILFEISPKDGIIELMQDIIHIRPELEEYITKKIAIIDMDLTLDKMTKDGIFKAFENSLDILLKTIYERINNSEYEQSENMLELNKKIKDKITRIFNSKII